MLIPARELPLVPLVDALVPRTPRTPPRAVIRSFLSRSTRSFSSRSTRSCSSRCRRSSARDFSSASRRSFSFSAMRSRSRVLSSFINDRIWSAVLAVRKQGSQLTTSAPCHCSSKINRANSSVLESVAIYLFSNASVCWSCDATR